MTELLKDDVPVLDFIIDELCKKGDFSSITAKYLGDKEVFSFGKKDTIGDLFLNETDNIRFERLASIIDEFDCAKTNPNIGLGNPFSISRNSKTLQFQKKDGFKKIYEKQLIRETQERIQNEKSEIDLRLKKWQVKTFWWIFGIAFIGFGFSVYNFINNLSSARNVKQQEVKIVKMESELEKLRISISNQKTIDSLNISKVLKNIENMRKTKNK